jgi:hypothetical protein
MIKYSLIDILSKEIEIEALEKKIPYKFDGIQIPMIQRDYAQGRENESDVRNRFLKAIFDNLENDKKIELDFVYGSVKELGRKKFFIPLDGQQRLTTIFLLHWYIGNRELRNNELQELRNILIGFTYATRVTSRKFCEKINQISISFLQKPSVEIKEAAWFFDSFIKDPTVKAMLVMLDAIHLVYGDTRKDLYIKLTNLSFYILPLDGFDLTDELYIKMNARGKQLTDFENFKADLSNWLKDDLNPFKNEFQKIIKFNSRETPYYLSFGAKIDNDWTNIFWSFTKLNTNPKEKLVDSYFLEFWNRYLLNGYISQSTLTQEAIEKDPLFLKFYKKVDNTELFKYHDFEFYKIILSQEGLIKQTELMFDRLSKHIKFIEELIKPSWEGKPTWNLFDKDINQRQRAFHYAVTVYFELNEFDEIKFKNWIRVIWNIIIDPNLRSIPAMIASIRLIKQLSEGSGDIYNYLKDNIDTAINENPRIKHEILKATLIIMESNWEAKIIEAEAHPMFKGNIRFLFPDLQQTSIETFSEFKNSAFLIFSKNDGTLGTPENNLWLRATLAKTNELALPITLADGKFDNWNVLINNQLLSGIIDILKIVNSSKNEIIKTIKLIIDEYNYNDKLFWLFNLIKWEDNDDKSLLDYSETQIVRKYQGYSEDFNEIYLFNQTIWTDGNILISNYRNEIISEILSQSREVKHIGGWRNIQNQFFRGWDILLERIEEGFYFTYLITRKNVKIGLKSTPELNEQLKDLLFNEEELEIGWICRLNFEYTSICQIEIQPFVAKIEHEVFNKTNPYSFINKLLNMI